MRADEAAAKALPVPPISPPEVGEFFADRTPKTLTVRGAPGAGKTTFSLSTLSAFKGSRIYVSTSVPRDALFRQFPWLSAPGHPSIRFIELLRFRTPAKESDDSVDQMRDVLQARASDLVDLASVLSLPRVLYDALAENEGQPKLVVIDSWEGWAENLLGGTSADLDVWSTRWVIERQLLDQILRTGAHVLMVVERDERNRFDYVVDGAISLSSGEFEGRQERWMALTKLRGVQIGSPAYPFTLDGAKFRCIVPMVSRPSLRPVGDETDPEPTARSLWPGSSAFATRFGRLPARGTLLLETDGETPLGVTWLLTAPMVLSALRAHGRVVLRPPAGLPLGELWRTISTAVPAQVASEGLRFVNVAAGPDSAGVPDELLLPAVQSPGSVESNLVAPAIDFLREGSGTDSPGLAVIFPHEEFDPGSDPQARDPYLGLPSLARRSGALLGAVMILRSEDPHIGQARVRSSVHLVLRARRGQFFLYGVRPWTPLFVVQVTEPGTVPSVGYDLIPIV